MMKTFLSFLICEITIHVLSARGRKQSNAVILRNAETNASPESRIIWVYNKRQGFVSYALMLNSLFSSTDVLL